MALMEHARPDDIRPGTNDRSDEDRIDLDTTVNEAIRRIPEAVAVFHDRGIDGCCGGALPIGEACARHGIDPDEVLGELEALRG